MIVVDASLALDLMLATSDSYELKQRLENSGEELVAPELLDLELLQSLRRQLRLKKITRARAAEAVDTLHELPVARIGHGQFLDRIWQLRDNLTAYDAAYVALAEAMEAPIWTRDRKYLGASGHRAVIEIV